VAGGQRRKQEGGGVTSTQETAKDRRASESWLRVELLGRGRTCTLILRGSLCGTSIAALEAQVDQLGCVPCDDVTVDLRELRAIDPVGANVLLGLYHYVDGRGGRLRVTGASDRIAITLRQYVVEYAEIDAGLADALLGSSDLMNASEGPLTDGEPGSTVTA
jgi:anti-anti-sigma regulatory factor